MATWRVGTSTQALSKPKRSKHEQEKVGSEASDLVDSDQESVFHEVDEEAEVDTESRSLLIHMMTVTT